MKAKKLIVGDNNDVYSRLNVSESDSNWSNAKDSDEEDASEEEYNDIDFKYNLVDFKNEKKMPNLRPFKGYRYMSFTIIMILILLTMVVWNM